MVPISLLVSFIHAPHCRCYAELCKHARFCQWVRFFFFQFQIALLWSSPPACEGAVQRRSAILINATHCCKIMQIDSPHLETHSERSYTTQNRVSTNFWTFDFFLSFSYLFWQHQLLLLLTSSSFLLSPPVQLLPSPLCLSPSPRCKNKWVNKKSVLFPSFHQNDDSLFSKFHHILCCRTFIPPGCWEHCTPPRGQTHSPAVEVIKTHP